MRTVFPTKIATRRSSGSASMKSVQTLSNLAAYVRRDGRKGVDVQHEVG